MSRRSAVTAGLIVAAALAVETWLLVGRRSGEAAYQPPAAVVVPSLEAAGADAITQTFVPGADGLAAVSFVPLLAARPAARPDRPAARGRRQRRAGGATAAAARRARRRRAVLVGPAADRTGGGARLHAAHRGARGGPGRGPAGGGRARPSTAGASCASDRGGSGAISCSRRVPARCTCWTPCARCAGQLPWPLRTDGALVIGLLLMNLAAAIVIGHLAGAGAEAAARIGRSLIGRLVQGTSAASQLLGEAGRPRREDDAAQRERDGRGEAGAEPVLRRAPACPRGRRHGRWRRSGPSG